MQGVLVGGFHGDDESRGVGHHHVRHLGAGCRCYGIMVSANLWRVHLVIQFFLVQLREHLIWRIRMKESVNGSLIAHLKGLDARLMICKAFERVHNFFFALL